MGFGDVLSGKQSLGSWLTGRDVSESDLAVKEEEAEATIDELVNIANSTPDVGSAVSSALAALNSTHGMDLIGGFQLSGVDTAFDMIEAQIKSVASVMDKRLGDAKYYSSSLPEKIFGTIGMGVAKLGEGFLSAFEDIGDGVVSVVGWIAPKDSGVEKWCEDFVKKDLAHGAFEWYYDSNLAKASAFTEDSAIAGACEIGGKAAGYLYAGGMINGLTGLKAYEAGSRAITATSKIGKAVQTFTHGAGNLLLKGASSSTWAATAAAGIGGLGAGTETGLYQGKSFDEAFTTNGVSTARNQAILAFAGGKLGEWGGRAKDVRALRKADPSLTRAAAKAQIKAGGNIYQGYSDSFTQAGERFGTSLHDTLGGGIKYVGSSTKNLLTKGGNAAKVTAAKDQFKAGVKGLAKENPLSQLVGGTFKGVGTAYKKGGVKEAAKQTAKDVGTALPRTVGSVGKAALGSWGGRAATVNSLTDQAGAHGKAEEQFRDTGMATKDGGPLPTDVPRVSGQVGEPKGQPTSASAADQFADTPTTTPTTTPTPTEKIPKGPGGPSGTPDSGTTPTPTLPPTTEPITPTQPSQPTVPPTVPPTGPAQTVVEQPTAEGVLPTQGGYGTEHDGAGYAGEDLEETLDTNAIKTSIDDIIKGNKYSKIPTSSAPIGRRATTTGSSVIPISAGLSAAAAVGLGAKAYLDKKSNDDDEDEEFAERWQGEGSVDIAPEKVEEEDVLLNEEGNSTLQSRILESVTGESYSDL